MVIFKTAYQIAQMFKNGEITAVEIVKSFIDRVEKYESKIDAFNSFNISKIIKRAELLDEKRSKGETLGPLAAVPFIIKDNILVKDEPTTCSSNMLKDYISTYDATVVKKIEDADGILFGKTNLDEFAMGSSTENSSFKITKNPWDLNRVPGGSSGGSSAAVAISMAPLALGSDTGGSIRQPAAFCGIVGIKPTYGRISRYGLVSFASSLDQIGPLSKNVEDSALALNVLSGHDENDSTTSQREVPDYLTFLNRDVSSLKIGVLDDDMMNGEGMEHLSSEMDKACKIFEKLGVKTEKVKIPAISHSIEAYYIIAPAEVSSNLSRLDGIKYGLAPKNPDTLEDIYQFSRNKGFGEEVKRRIMIGNYVLSSSHYDNYYKKAYQVRRVIKNGFDKAFEKYDAILLPTTPTTAFRIGENTSDPIKMYLSDLFTACANLAGLPGISIPLSIINGLPTGIQLIGKQFDEGTIISLAHALEKERGEFKTPEIKL